MKSSLSIDEYDLVQFFSALPTQLDKGVPWEYTESVYESSDSPLHLSFAIAPAMKDVRILVTIGGTCVYEFNAVGVADLRYRTEKRRESLEVVVASNHSVWLTVKPQISICQSVSENAADRWQSTAQCRASNPR
jgi:hypothetical protein